ncbi:hypothetical protein ACLOJK_028279, partial [Asimina triloba]
WIGAAGVIQRRLDGRADLENEDGLQTVGCDCRWRCDDGEFWSADRGMLAVDLAPWNGWIGGPRLTAALMESVCCHGLDGSQVVGVVEVHRILDG